MTKKEKPEPTTSTEQTTPQQEFQILGFYIKDLSFEAPQSPQIFKAQKNPSTIQISQEISHHKIEENQYEVSLRLHAEAKTSDAPDASIIFLIEVKQAGLFHIAGLNDLQLNHALESVAPTILFPYARQLISTLTLQGGFSPLNLPHFNFEQQFIEKMQKQTATMQ